MEEKINIAKLLKDCPKGMELDCIMYNKVTLLSVDEECTCFPIRVKREDGNSITLTKYGQYTDADFAKCVIFPKGKTTWEGFVPPCKFKDGDIIYVKDKHNNWCSIMNKCENDKLYTYVDICINSNTFYHNSLRLLCDCEDIIEYRLATEKEKQKLFDAIKAKGYKWNIETKNLEKLVEPRFKVGDRIVKKNSVCVPILITNVSDEFYYSTTESSIGVLSISEQDEYVLLPNKFDITTLIPFESRVLVRDNDYDEWKGAFWSHLRQKADIKYDTIRGVYRQCIPYEGNEHLLGKTDDCDEYFKTWL